MNDDDRKEIQAMITQAVLTKKDIQDDIIKPLLATVNAYHEGDLKLINVDLKRILEQTTKHNQRMTKIEKKAQESDEKIVELEKKEIAHVLNCPYNEKLRPVEDYVLTQKTTKKVIIGSITLATIVISSLITILKFVQV